MQLTFFKCKGMGEKLKLDNVKQSKSSFVPEKAIVFSVNENTGEISFRIDYKSLDFFEMYQHITGIAITNNYLKIHGSHTIRKHTLENYRKRRQATRKR